MKKNLKKIEIREIFELRNGARVCKIQYSPSGTNLTPHTDSYNAPGAKVFHINTNHKLSDLWILEFSYFLTAHPRPTRLI